MQRCTGLPLTRPSSRFCLTPKPTKCTGLCTRIQPRVVSTASAAADVVQIVTEFPVLSTVAAVTLGFLTVKLLSAAISPAPPQQTQITAAEAVAAVATTGAFLLDIRAKDVVKEEGLVDLPGKSLLKLPFSQVSQYTALIETSPWRSRSANHVISRSPK